MKVSISWEKWKLKSAKQKLSEDRVKAVKEYLLKKGIEPDRLSTAAYESSRPKTSNISPVGQAVNRRIEFRPVP